jgi:DNA topoisomerase-3
VADGSVVSYGPCQFPTLGFIAHQYQRHAAFRKERFWSLQLWYEEGAEDSHEGGAAGSIQFHWCRVRVFDEAAALLLLEECVSAGRARVSRCVSQPTSKWRPKPLSTITFQKNMSRYFRVSSHRAMETAEALYQRGVLSYPRTETDCFGSDAPLQDLVALLADADGPHAEYARRLAHGGEFLWPGSGGNDDKAHPPIHPLRALRRDDCSAAEWQVYDYVVRHFLASCSRDARGQKSEVWVRVGGEAFRAQGLMVAERNYLDVFPWDRWADRELPLLREGATFVPARLFASEGLTSAPALLSESALLTLMHRHGIGTDATMAQHIDTVQKREYARVTPQHEFVPTALGLALVEAYDRLGTALSEPEGRAQLERDVASVAAGTQPAAAVVERNVAALSAVFQTVVARQALLLRTCEEALPVDVGRFSVAEASRLRRVRAQEPRRPSSRRRRRGAGSLA